MRFMFVTQKNPKLWLQTEFADSHYILYFTPNLMGSQQQQLVWMSFTHLLGQPNKVRIQ